MDEETGDAGASNGATGLSQAPSLFSVEDGDNLTPEEKYQQLQQVPSP